MAPQHNILLTMLCLGQQVDMLINTHCWRPLLFPWNQPNRNRFHGCFRRNSHTIAIEIFEQQTDYFFWNTVDVSNCYFLGHIKSTSLIFLLEYFIKYFPWNSVNISNAISPVIYMQFITCFRKYDKYYRNSLQIL